MTIIFSNTLDADCAVLRDIWSGVNGTFIEITPDTPDGWEDVVDDAIANEEDTLVMIGHGSSYGLFYPVLDGRNEYIIHENNIHLIKARNVICFWCYASDFVIAHPELHNVFASSMFITNVNESYNNTIYDYDQNEINRVSRRTQEELLELLNSETQLSDWIMRFGAHMDIENAIDVFNRQGFYYQR